MSVEQDKSRIDKMFKNLVESALDFLRRALDEIEQEPKYSIIHFCAAVELILKARLMHEHWTLIVASRQNLDWEQFASGDFRSVSLDEANDRLLQVVGSGFSDQEFRSFESVSKHRNRIVHFLNDADKETVAKDVWSAWYFLHKVLTASWKDIFASWAGDILQIDLRMRDLRPYLKMLFDQKRDEIEELKRCNIPVVTCHFCWHPALKCEADLHYCYDTFCLVCEIQGQGVNVACKECGGVMVFEEEGDGRCVSASCGNILPREELVYALSAIDLNSKEAHEVDCRGHCVACSDLYTMVLTKNEEFVCATCLSVFSRELVKTCECCHQLSAGVKEISSVFGCEFCKGNNELHRD